MIICLFAMELFCFTLPLLPRKRLQHREQGQVLPPLPWPAVLGLAAFGSAFEFVFALGGFMCCLYLRVPW
jgi:hypothetical protein